MKKTLNLLSQVFTCLVVLLAVCMAVFTVISLRTVDAAHRDLFGYKAFIVQTDSMSASDFSAGDLIFVKEVEPRSLEVGDIIAYISQNQHNYGETVTHKIRQLTTDDSGAPGFITYGTTTGTNDEAVVTYSSVLGKYTGKLPGVGRFFAFLKTPAGYVCLILLPFLLILGYCGWNCYKLFRQYRQEEKATRETQLDAQRREIQELRREVQELKAMILGGKVPPQSPLYGGGSSPQRERPKEQASRFPTAPRTSPASPRGERRQPEGLTERGSSDNHRRNAPSQSQPRRTFLAPKTSKPRPPQPRKAPTRQTPPRRAPSPPPEDALDFESIMREFGGGNSR